MPDTFDFGPVADCEDHELRLLLAQLDQATHEWLGEIDGDVTPDELTWQAVDDGHSIGALMVHIAEVEAFWLHHVATGAPYRDLEAEALGAAIDQDAALWPTPPPGRPFAYYAGLLRTVRETTRALIPTLGDPARQIARTRADGSVQTYTLRWLLTHVLLHEAYHGGQAILLLLQQRKGALS